MATCRDILLSFNIICLSYRYLAMGYDYHEEVVAKYRYRNEPSGNVKIYDNTNSREVSVSFFERHWRSFV